MPITVPFAAFSATALPDRVASVGASLKRKFSAVSSPIAIWSRTMERMLSTVMTTLGPSWLLAASTSAKEAKAVPLISMMSPCDALKLVISSWPKTPWKMKVSADSQEPVSISLPAPPSRMFCPSPPSRKSSSSPPGACRRQPHREARWSLRRRSGRRRPNRRSRTRYRSECR